MYMKWCIRMPTLSEGCSETSFKLVLYVGSVRTVLMRLHLKEFHCDNTIGMTPFST
jgi:hypothetical protein